MTDTKFDLAAVKAACEGHSKAPWWLNPELQTDEDSGIRYYEILDADGHEVHNQTGFQYDGDAKVATAAPALLAECERLTAKVERLTKRDAKLSALEEAGVDNWDGYSEAMRILRDFKAQATMAHCLTEIRAALEGGDTNGK